MGEWWIVRESPTPAGYGGKCRVGIVHRIRGVEKSFSQSTHPHHKHIPPDIKHNRIPAPGLSFDEPNLPFLIREVEGLIGRKEE